MIRHPCSSIVAIPSIPSLARALLRATLVVSSAAPSFAATTDLGGPAPERAAAAPMLEPTTLLLVGIGLVGIAVFRTRYRHEKQ